MADRSPKPRTPDGADMLKRKASLAAMMPPHPATKPVPSMLWTAGRPPWFSHAGEKRRAFVIGVSGGTASGKTSVCRKIVQALDLPWVTMISLDSFYRGLEGEDLAAAHRSEFNFDHPNAFDARCAADCLRRLKNGESVTIPLYDFVEHKSVPRGTTVYGADVIIFEGILAMYFEELRDLFDMKIFVDCDDDTRLARRVRRDIAERGRTVDGVLKQYLKFVKPSFDEYIAPTKSHADIVIPRGGDNSIAIQLITEHLEKVLKERGATLKRGDVLARLNNERLPESVTIMPDSVSLRNILTILRDADTKRDDFIFHSNRLFRIVIERALGVVLEYEEVTITTPTGAAYKGMRPTSKLCGVSIMRAGETMEVGLREVLIDVSIGKLLIQSEPTTGEPHFFYSKLPANVAEGKVLLMDPTVGTAATAMMAVRILKDHGVPEANIVLVTCVASHSGLCRLCYTFPKLRVITAAVDPHLNEKFYIMPGVGNYGERWFGE